MELHGASGRYNLACQLVLKLQPDPVGRTLESLTDSLTAIVRTNQEARSGSERISLLIKVMDSDRDGNLCSLV